ncbi:hypothetical protein KEM55_009154, partial [Ascosphaera atra]
MYQAYHRYCNPGRGKSPWLTPTTGDCAKAATEVKVLTQEDLDAKDLEFDKYGFLKRKGEPSYFDPIAPSFDVGKYGIGFRKPWTPALLRETSVEPAPISDDVFTEPEPSEAPEKRRPTPKPQPALALPAFKDCTCSNFPRFLQEALVKGLEDKILHHVNLVELAVNGLEKACHSHLLKFADYVGMETGVERLELERRVKAMALTKNTQEEFMKKHSEWFRRHIIHDLNRGQKRPAQEEPSTPHHTKKARRTKTARRLEPALPIIYDADVKGVYHTMRRLDPTIRYNDQNPGTILVINGTNSITFVDDTTVLAPLSLAATSVADSREALSWLEAGNRRL